MSLFCAMDEDIEQWQAKNRVPLFPGKINRWLLVRTDRDDPDDKTIHSSTRGVFVQWFKSSARWGFDTGHADLLEVKEVVRGKSPPAFPRVLKNHAALERLPFIRVEKVPIWVAVEFAYRGTSADMPWPVHKQQILNPWCPVEADWMLYSVGETERDAPPQDTSMPGLGEIAETASKHLLRPVLIGAGVVVGVIVLTRVLK